MAGGRRVVPTGRELGAAACRQGTCCQVRGCQVERGCHTPRGPLGPRRGRAWRLCSKAELPHVVGSARGGGVEPAVDLLFFVGSAHALLTASVRADRLRNAGAISRSNSHPETPAASDLLGTGALPRAGKGWGVYSRVAEDGGGGCSEWLRRKPLCAGNAAAQATTSCHSIPAHSVGCRGTDSLPPFPRSSSESARLGPRPQTPRPARGGPRP